MVLSYTLQLDRAITVCHTSYVIGVVPTGGDADTGTCFLQTSNVASLCRRRRRRRVRAAANYCDQYVDLGVSVGPGAAALFSSLRLRRAINNA